MTGDWKWEWDRRSLVLHKDGNPQRFVLVGVALFSGLYLGLCLGICPVWSHGNFGFTGHNDERQWVMIAFGCFG